MSVINELEDTELISEMVVLLGRELRVARRHIQELEMRLKEPEEPQMSLNEDQKDLMQKRIKILEDELFKQREETSAATTAHLSTLARAEAAEKALEVHAEEIAKVTDLEHTLASYQEKYKAEREAKRAFRRSCRELQAQLNTISDDEKDASLAQGKSEAHQDDMQEIENNGKCRRTGRDSERERCEHGDKEGGGGTAVAKHPGIGAVNQFIRRLPNTATRPSYTCLIPICEDAIDLHSHLTSVLGSLCPQNIFFFPNRMTIHPRNYHAVVFSPAHVWVNNGWSKPSELVLLPGQVRALFYLKRKSIYYIGDYRCHRAEDLFPDSGGIKLPNHIESFSSYIGR